MLFAVLVSCFVFCPLHFLYILETLIYNDQKYQVGRRFTAVTQLEALLAKYHIFNSVIQKLNGSKQKYFLRTLILGITETLSSS